MGSIRKTDGYLFRTVRRRGLLRDTSRNGDLCTFVKSRSNVLNRLARQQQRIVSSLQERRIL
jgi:hypothetical protein